MSSNFFNLNNTLMAEVGSLDAVAAQVLQNYNLVPRGSALITTSGQLKLKGITNILHAATGTMNMYSSSEPYFEPTLESVAQSIQASCILAKANGIKKVAVPFVASGSFLNRIFPGITPGAAQRGQLAATILQACFASKDTVDFCITLNDNADYQIFLQQIAVSFPEENAAHCILHCGILDFAHHQSDAIVNAANMELQFGGGISGIIGTATHDSMAIDQAARTVIQQFWKDYAGTDVHASEPMQAETGVVHPIAAPVAQPAAPASGAVAVLTYNVSFEAMTHSSHGTAGPLGAKCTFVTQGVTTCAQNIARMIDAIPAKLNISSLDFIGLQEARNWQYWQQEGKQTLSKMKSVGNSTSFQSQGKTVLVEIATLYDAGKYKLENQAFDIFSQGRPYQILVFSEIADTTGTQGVIFINLHCPHHTPQGANLTYPYLTGQLSKTASTMHLTNAQKGYRMIVVGDCNETEWNWYKKTLNNSSWQPLSGAGVMQTVSIDATHLVFSCAQADGNWSDGHGGTAKGDRAGDYIFDSHAAALTMVPPNYDPTVLQSDHLPVMAVLN